MRVRSKLLVAGALSATVLTGACVTDPETGQRSISRAGIGAIGGVVGGYLLGDLVGGRRDRTEKILGAGDRDALKKVLVILSLDRRIEHPYPFRK